MTTDTPLTRYRAIKGAPASGSSLPSYTTWWDTTAGPGKQGLHLRSDSDSPSAETMLECSAAALL